MCLPRSSFFKAKSSCNEASTSRITKKLKSFREPSHLQGAISWIKGQTPVNYVFRAKSLEIDAKPEAVYQAAIKLDQFFRLSDGAVTASINGDLTLGNTVKLQLYKDKWFGKLIPTVHAKVIVADKVGDHWFIGWSVPLPFRAGFTERYHLIEASSDQKTQSYIADKVSGVVGFFSNALMKNLIEEAFKNLNEGLKNEVETHQLKN